MGHRCRIIVPLLVVAGCLVTPSGARAQEDGATAAKAADSVGQDAWSVRVAVGAGPARYRTYGGEDSPLPIVTGGLQWQRPRSRLSARLELSYEENIYRESPHYFDACAGGCRDEQETRSFGLTLDGQLDLTRSAVRPYVLSGFGVYEVQRRQDKNFVCIFPVGPEGEGCFAGADPQVVPSSRGLILGLHAGAGVGVTLGRATIFTEARLALRSERPLEGTRVPIFLGVRF